MRNTYWKKREKLRYYGIVRYLLEDMGHGDLLLDVGSSNTPVATYGDFDCRIAVDVRKNTKLPGVEMVQADWLTYQLPGVATVVTCLQVLEHLPNDVIGEFTNKLLSSAEHVIISVPFRWKKGRCKFHKQDPIDESKLRRMMGKNPLETIVVAERPYRMNSRRLIAIYSGRSRSTINAPMRTSMCSGVICH